MVSCALPRGRRVMPQGPATRSFSPEADKTPQRELTLLMNQGAVLVKDGWVKTVLGSCVSVTFHCAYPVVAGMFHAQLPTRTGPLRDDANTWRFVDTSIGAMLEAMEAAGAQRRLIRAKLFGGASMNQGIYSVGMRNVETALAALAEHRIPVVARNVGGLRGRKIMLRTSTGEVMHRFLRPVAR